MSLSVFKTVCVTCDELVNGSGLGLINNVSLIASFDWISDAAATAADGGSGDIIFVLFDGIKLSTTRRSLCNTIKSRSVCQIQSKNFTNRQTIRETNNLFKYLKVV